MYDVLGVERAVAAMQSYGSTRPEQVRRQIARWKQLLDEHAVRESHDDARFAGSECEVCHESSQRLCRDRCLVAGTGRRAGRAGVGPGREARRQTEARKAGRGEAGRAEARRGPAKKRPTRARSRQGRQDRGRTMPKIPPPPDPAVEAVLETKPTTPAGVTPGRPKILSDLHRDDLAKSMLQKVLAAQLDDEQL